MQTAERRDGKQYIRVTDKIQTNNNSNFPQYTDSWAVKTLYFKVYMIKSYNLLQKKKNLIYFTADTMAFKPFL